MTLVELSIHELSYLLTLMAPQVVAPAGEEKLVVELFLKLNPAFCDLKADIEGKEDMPAGAKSYQAAHIPDRANDKVSPGSRSGHAEPAMKKNMPMKTVAQVEGEAAHLPAPRDSEMAVAKGRGRTSIKENAGS